jgi:hypothetical protein
MFWGLAVDGFFIEFPIIVGMTALPIFLPKISPLQSIGLGLLGSICFIYIFRGFVIPRLFPKQLCLECEQKEASIRGDDPKKLSIRHPRT